MSQAIELTKILLERATVITQLNAHRLKLDWLKEAPIPTLIACCNRMDDKLSGVYVDDKLLQRELIHNPAFASYYAKLLPLFPEDTYEEQKPEPVRNTYYYKPSTQPTQLSRRMIIMVRLCKLLEDCRSHDKDITVYPVEQLMAVLEMNTLSDDVRLIFLENFAPMDLPDTARQIVINSFQRCHKIPLELTEHQKSLLLNQLVSTQHIFTSAPFTEIADLLGNCPKLLDIARLLHDRHVYEELTLEHYKGFAQNVTEYHNLLTELLNQLKSDAAGVFMTHWQQNSCPIYELKTMLRRTADRHDLNWVELLSTKSGYVNILYGAKFKQIDLASVSYYQESILIYAIVHNKKHFIRLVDEHPEVFLALPNTSMIFQEKLYHEHFNLNELTERDLKDCGWMTQDKLNAESLYPGQRYTFPELRELYNVPSCYMSLYHLLQSSSQDYRLRVFRQIHKRDILRTNMHDTELSALAANLDIKPLDVWIQQDFKHISDLTAYDAAQMLGNMDKLRHLLPYMGTRIDVLLALRCLDRLEQYNSIAELKEDLLQTDADWSSLSEIMDLTSEFQNQHRESIISFLCNNGAYIAETYRKGLDERQQDAFLRVVKAELMGQLGNLKYYEGDLQRELDSPITDRIISGWRENISVTKNSLEVQEYDDFFSTMQLGTQPQRTCLSYLDGAYRGCLLSAFDSNKKILYATLNGRIVGRAFLRLTKGRLTGVNTKTGKGDDGFTFVDLEHPTSHQMRPKECERLTLFLERPYISGIGPELAQCVMQMFIDLAGRKADMLDTMLVLSADYRNKGMTGFTWTRYAIYISKSKAGAQYLDSLGGHAAVSDEGSYTDNTFLVREQSGATLACNY